MRAWRVPGFDSAGFVEHVFIASRGRDGEIDAVVEIDIEPLHPQARWCRSAGSKPSSGVTCSSGCSVAKTIVPAPSADQMPPLCACEPFLGDPKCDVSAHARHLVSQQSTDSAPLPFRTMTNRSDRSNTKYSTPSPFFDPNQFNVHPSGR